MMSNTRSSPAKTKNPLLAERPREQPLDSNLDWLKKHGESSAKSPQSLALLLLGGTGPDDLRLRVAQSHVRHDMTPSSWSHVVMMEPSPRGLTERTAREVSLTPPKGFAFPPRTNGLQVANLETYADPQRYPNIAVLHIPLPADPEGEAKGLPTPLEHVQQMLGAFPFQRGVLDVVQLITLWLPFVWGVGATPNPLLEGHGIPSAAMVEAILAAAGYDISPSVSSRASCPETIWQAARWWHDYLAREGAPGAIQGAYTAPHSLCFGSHD
ncbi:hypothetical protein LXT21_20390 [Myxococcus sp. K38C18041901]|uniref:hypothetical protein n=1 Tax=Myxococcus guangdongensis TaxID=2906760 RepID=UPI0020A6F907|nr:hypothetical protein [Myxococcus guangdongensis]MCP3061143.1 hypothetical protein [Myxococcus guangdongensis]